MPAEVMQAVELVEVVEITPVAGTVEVVTPAVSPVVKVPDIIRAKIHSQMTAIQSIYLKMIFRFEKRQYDELISPIV